MQCDKRSITTYAQKGQALGNHYSMVGFRLLMSQLEEYQQIRKVIGPNTELEVKLTAVIALLGLNLLILPPAMGTITGAAIGLGKRIGYFFTPSTSFQALDPVEECNAVFAADKRSQKAII